MPKTAANPDDIHAIALLEELIQPNPLHLCNQGTKPLQILHQKKRMQGSCCSSWDALNAALLQVYPKSPAPGTWGELLLSASLSLKLSEEVVVL